MQFPHIRNLDLSLVELLYALLDERHVTRAAHRCNMSQSAMSRALGRLRSALDDELLVRCGAAHERTPRGDQLLVDLRALLPRLDAAVRGNQFDPATSTDRICIATTDYADRDGNLIRAEALPSALAALQDSRGIERWRGRSGCSQTDGAESERYTR
jgi:DNA-binding transcriptional LysR family regulator